VRVLITGGAGFIGSHVAELFAKRGFDVVVLDDLSTGNRANVDELVIDYDIKVIERAAVGLPYCLPDEVDSLDGIIHLGQPSSSPLYWCYPELFYKTIQEMQAVLQTAYRFECPVVYASSSSVYAGNKVPWREDMRIEPWDRYSEVKYICERMGILWARRQGLKFVALRLFSVYGKREEYKGNFANLFTQLIWSGLTGRRLKIFGLGDQTRDLVYVEDVAEAFYKALQLAYTEKPGFYDVFNVGSGKPYSIREMVTVISMYGGVKPVVEYLGFYPQFYIMHTCADINKAVEGLEWRPRHAPEEVVRRLVDYYATRMDVIAEWSPEPPTPLRR